MLPKERAMELVRPALDQIIGDKEKRRRIMDDVEARDIKLNVAQLCRLWAGMGSIYKISISDDMVDFVVKHVTPPSSKQQSFGDRRKAKSYQVEANFYQHVAKDLLYHQQSPSNCLILPTPYMVDYGPKPDEVTICMSYLQGPSINTERKKDVHATLRWLAHFHAAYWGTNIIDELVNRVGLQPVASYWHLDTRPDEHAAMSRRGWHGRLKLAASALDSCLKRDSMQCLVHGDPKEANIMKLQQDNGKIAMYDFQYCGKGTPTRDLAYFLCSSCDEDGEDELVQYYYQELSNQLNRKGVIPPNLEHFQKSLLLAFCDFYRFLCGWGQWGYDLQDKAQLLLQKLDHGKDLGSEDAYEKAIRHEFW